MRNSAANLSSSRPGRFYVLRGGIGEIGIWARSLTSGPANSAAVFVRRGLVGRRGLVAPLRNRTTRPAATSAMHTRSGGCGESFRSKYWSSASFRRRERSRSLVDARASSFPTFSESTKKVMTFLLMRHLFLMLSDRIRKSRSLNSMTTTPI